MDDYQAHAVRNGLLVIWQCVRMLERIDCGFCATECVLMIKKQVQRMGEAVASDNVRHSRLED